MSNVASQLEPGDRIEILPAEGAGGAEPGEYEVLMFDVAEGDDFGCYRRMENGRIDWLSLVAIERRGQTIRIVSEPRTETAAARPQQGG